MIIGRCLEIVSRSPDGFHGVLWNYPVMRDKNKLLLLRLRYEHPIERISMNVWQTLYALKMRGENRQMAKTSQTAKAIVFGYGDVAVQSSKALFDGDLP